MKCLICGRQVVDAEHIAVDDNGDPQVMCCKCFDKVRIFFPEVKRRGKIKS